MSSIAAEATNTQPAPAKVHPEFEWIRSEPIETLNLVVEEYRHKVTGACHYHLSADNPENVFLVAFRTVPGDSRGVAHILEHTALCGSKRYPVRDPFFMMIRRSLNTFMNAFTSSDWTAYPFASQNRKDFDNLTDVYLDAVFFTRLHELDFAQEGHRLEFSEPNNPNTELLFKGVVFNEMKGAMSSTVSTLWQNLTKYLFPTTTYHFNSGGDPEDIPDLSYQQLKDFYNSHYHPSNAMFMTYGDIPAIEHQKKFHEQALSEFEKLDIHIAVPDEKRYHAPIRVQESYPLDEAELTADKTHHVVGWLLGPSINLMEQLEASLLEGVLLDDSASPLRKALEKSDLGSAPSPLCGLEASNREMSFVCGLEGSRAEHAGATEELILTVLKDVAENGIPKERVEAVLHQLELGQREISGDGYPYGLQLILEGISSAIHRGDPSAVLNIDPALEELRQQIEDPDYIRRLVRERLLENQHRVLLTMIPDTQLSARKDQAEADRLERIKLAMNDAEKKNIVDQAAALAERQTQEDDPGVLPKVGLEDIPEELHIAAGSKVESTIGPTSHYAQGTNGLLYQQIIIDMPEISDELLDFLPYYTSNVAQLGCGGRDYLETQALHSSVSGGVHASSSVRGAVDDVQKVKGIAIFSGKSLVRNHAALTQLLQDTLESPRFDELERIRELTSQQRARREESIVGNGHGLAMTAASAGMSAGAALSHRLRGLESIRFIKQLDDSLSDEAKLKEMAEKFEALHQSVHSAGRQFLLIGESERLAQAQDELQQVWSKQQTAAQTASNFSLPSVEKQIAQAWVTNTQVNFCARAYPTVAIDHEDSAPLSVLSGFLRNGYLHRSIREQGGAYGGGASHDTDNASFRFFSYRDPRLAETLQDFDQSVRWLLDNKHEWRLVEEAILGVISSIDKPGSPAGEAKDSFYSDLFGRTPLQRNQFRQRVLEVTAQDLQRVGETYLNPERASTAVICNATSESICTDLGLEIQLL